MGWDGAGGYTRQHSFSADASSGIKILASRMDTELDDFASAMTIAWSRNGQNVPTQDIPMGGRKFINVAAATSVNNYMRVREFIENVPIFMHDQESSADRISVSAQYFTSVSANQAPGDGTRILVRMASDKTSAPLYLNGHSANVEFQGGSRAVNALVSGGIYEMVFSSAAAVWKVSNPDVGRTASERSAGVTPRQYQFPFLHVSRYYDAADGDDWSLAFARAVDVASVEGGTIVFDSAVPQHIGWGSEVEIATDRCVSIIGNMHVNPNATEDSRYIYPLNNITGSMIKYTSPTASLTDGGGGVVSGLAFFDSSGDIDSATLDERRGSYTMTAALELEAFSLATIKDCSFHYINGSALRVGFAVMSNFDRIWIRYCGSTGNPAFNHPSGTGYAMQSCTVSNVRMEVNFDEPYLYVHGNSNCKDNKWIGLGFEASPTAADAGYGIEYFIDYNADFSTFVACHFNRNGETYAMRISGDDNEVVGIIAETSWGGAFEITGNRNTVIGGSLAASNSAISTILISGQGNSIDGTKLYFANRIYVTGPNNTIRARMFDCTSAGTYLIEGTAGAGNLKVYNSFLRNVNSNRAVSPSGISVAAACTITGNTLIGNTTGPAATGINVGTSNQIVTDNWLDGYTNEIVHNSHMVDAIIGRNFGFVTEAKGQATINSGSTSVAVTHGLGYTPSLQDIRIVFGEQATNDYGRWWIDTITSTQFTVNVSTDPGASHLTFGWSVAPR